MMHSVEGADHVGAYLREARETTGRTVADVAQNLRIRRVYLEAIEDGRFDELPGATYAVGFVRSYAAYLNLDAPELVARFKEEASGIQAKQELEFPTPVPEGRFPGGLLVSLCLLLAGAAFGGWYWYQSQNSVEVARVPAPPASPFAAAPNAADTGEGAPVVAAREAPVSPTASADRPAVVPETVAQNEAPPEAAPEPARAAETPAEDVPLVPPSYLEPQADPLASMADVPSLDGAVGNPTPDAAPEDVTRAANAAAQDVPDTVAAAEESVPAGNAMAEPTAADNAPVTGERDPAVTEAAAAPAPTDTAPATVPATVPEAMATETATPEAPEPSTQVATVPPPSAAFSGEPAIVALPEIDTNAASAPEAASDREGRTFGARNASARIILRAQENTWVQVRDADESVVITQMLESGDRYMVPNRDGLRLMTGNAGGLEILVDGEAVPAIGIRGESRRDVRLDPGRLRAGSAVVE